MREWEIRAIELLQDIRTEDIALDILQLELKTAGILSSDHLMSHRVDMAQQIINNVKEKNG